MATRNRFRVRAEVTISLSQVVDADSPAAALEAAKQFALPRITQPQERSEEWQTSGELDGHPCNFTVEDEATRSLAGLLGSPDVVQEALQEVVAAESLVPTEQTLTELLVACEVDLTYRPGAMEQAREFVQVLDSVRECLQHIRTLLQGKEVPRG